ncbi:MAG: peroxiredoxin [Nitrososphaerota archaeon]|nr:peroxiredoxin [Nitrososphaerota archaeon]MDG6939953.1 peroxiredoxin [Nitrososphaerota archaeon]
MVGIGDRMPDVALLKEDGREVRIGDYLGRWLVIYFYPKDGSPGCTREACAFRDMHDDFSRAGATVLGVSSDPPESHRRFRGRYSLDFELLSDPGGAARKAFGVPKTLGLIDGRVTYVVDREGVVRHVFRSQVRAARHARFAADSLAEGRA